MLDQVLSYSDESITVEDVHEVNGTLSQESLGEFVTNIFLGNILEVLNLIDKYNDSGKNIIKLSEEIIVLLKNILLYKTVDNYFEDNNSTLYQELGNNIEVNKLINLIDSFNESIPKLKQSNDPKLILELLIIKYISSLNKKQTEETIKTIVTENISQNNQIIKSVEKVTEKVQEEIKTITSKPEIVRVEKPTKITNEVLEKLEEVKKVRVNNTLARFNKKLFVELKEKLENIRDMLLIPEYSQIVSTILDGTLKAASDKNLIFVYETESLANYFNENLLKIEEILEQNYNTHYDVIAVDNISWEIIKKEFNSKSKQYVYAQETINLKDLLLGNETKDELNELFGEIVEIVN